MVEMTRSSKGIRGVDILCLLSSPLWAAIVAITLNGVASQALGQQVSAALNPDKPTTAAQPSPKSDPGITTEEGKLMLSAAGGESLGQAAGSGRPPSAG
jgi:hypothetical protein